MADATKTKHPTSPSQTALLEEKEWEWIARCLKTHGATPDTLAWVGPRLWRLLGIREQRLPVTQRLPPPILGVLHLTLTTRTFKKPRPRPPFDHTAIAQYMHPFVEDQGLTVVAAAWKAVSKFGCAHGSAMAWYYQWRKPRPQ